MSFPGISVIIRARGGSDHIRSCIQKVESEHVHVIMVDDVDVLERVSLDDDSAKELILSIRSLSKKVSLVSTILSIFHWYLLNFFLGYRSLFIHALQSALYHPDFWILTIYFEVS